MKLIYDLVRAPWVRALSVLCVVCAVGFLAGCASQEKMYASRMEVQSKRDSNAMAIEQKKWDASAACYAALGQAAASSEPLVRMGAMLALDKCRPDSAGGQIAAAPPAPLPDVPESGALTTLRITSALLGTLHPFANTALSYLNQRDSTRANRDIQLGHQAMIGGMFANQGRALVDNSASAFGAIKDLGAGALDAIGNLKPNITVQSGGALVQGNGTANTNNGTTTTKTNSENTTNTCGATGGAGASGQTSAGVGTPTQPAGASASSGGAGGTANTTCTKS